MPSKDTSSPELILPVESDQFWNKVFKERSSASSTVVDNVQPQQPQQDISVTTTTTASTTTASTDIDSLADPVKQHEYVDNNVRSTEGIDYDQLRNDALELVNLRKELESQKRMSEFRKVGKERYPYFAKKFPHFFDSIRTVEKNRLNEFLNVMHMMLDKLNQVKRNVLSHTEMRTEVFEKDLAHKYYQRGRH